MLAHFLDQKDDVINIQTLVYHSFHVHNAALPSHCSCG